jgi:6-phosphofructokinase 1
MKNKAKIKRIGVFTSGGDSPGMNAAIRAVVRAGINYKIEVYGIMRGYEGMIDGDYKKLETQDVSNIIQHGGTILKTARSDRFLKKEGREQAFENLNAAGIDSIIAIGGDGTFRGALDFSKDFKMPIIGIPGTIDNDLFGTDNCIGYDTAINTVIQAVDKLRDTAASHDRLFFVEVMGRDSGLIALRSGIACGAEAILIPEFKTDINELVKLLERGYEKKKESSIIIVAEGDDKGGAFEIAKQVKKKFNNYDTRVTVLGHIQRGGSPTCMDRVIASRMGIAAVQGLLEGKRDVMAGILNRKIVYTHFSEAGKHNTEMNKTLTRVAEILAL